MVQGLARLIRQLAVLVGAKCGGSCHIRRQPGQLLDSLVLGIYLGRKEDTKPRTRMRSSGNREERGILGALLVRPEELREATFPFRTFPIAAMLFGSHETSAVPKPPSNSLRFGGAFTFQWEQYSVSGIHLDVYLHCYHTATWKYI